MPKCKKCQGEMPHGFAHREGCTPVSAPEVKQENIVEKLDKIVTVLGGLSSRIDKLENPLFKGPEPKKEDVIAKSLQATIEINKQISNPTDPVSDNLKCAYGIHYPSDFGQGAFFDGNGKPIPGKFTPAKRRCMPATPELRKIIDEVLTPEFDVDILPDPASATFLLSIIVPAKYCIRDEFRYGGMKDIRAKVINNFNSSAEVKAYALKVKERVYKDHMAAQLPSPFTMPSMRDTVTENVPYTQKQVLI